METSNQVIEKRGAKLPSLFGKYLRQYVLFIILILLGAILSIASPHFLTLNNIMNILRQVSFVGIAGIGMTLIIISGAIDLSVGGIAALVGVITSSLVKELGVPLLPSILAGVGLGALFGFINGLSISKLNIPPFIQTLVMMNFAIGLAFVYSKAQPIYDLPSSMTSIATTFIGPVPLLVIIMLTIYLIVNVMLNRTVFGRRIFALGGNVNAAKYSGINTDRIRIAVFSIMGLLAGGVGILLAARVTAGDPNTGTNLSLDAIAATVMGGTSIGGGVGGVTGTIIGAIIIGVIDNALVLLNFSSWWQPIVKALVIFIAVFIDAMNKRKKA